MTKVSNICVNCGEITVNPKFCNRSCSTSYNNKKNPRRQLGMYTCLACDKPIYSGRKFCKDHSLKLKWLTITLGEARKARTYQANSRIRNLARASYIADKRPLICLICRYDKMVHICHIKDIFAHKETETVAAINSPSNLVPLCPNHHYEFDNDLL